MKNKKFQINVAISIFFLFFGLTLLSWGCSQKEETPGVVARVNDEAITLSQLESRFDLLHLEWNEALRPSVESLRKEYGQVLGSLIIQKLVEQELEKRSLKVTSKELSQAENKIRSDYPEGAFEEVLIEEYIDLDVWREQLRQSLAREKLVQEVLRPKIQMSYKEVARYYEKHISDFYLPAQLDFLLVQSPERKAVDNAVGQGDLRENWKKLQKKPELNVNRMHMRIDRIPSSWHEALKNLEPGERSAIFAVDKGFICLVLFERERGKILKLPQAYPLVEKAIWNRKLEKAFSEWVKGKFAQAEIQITPLLQDWKEKQKKLANSSEKNKEN